MGFWHKRHHPHHLETCQPCTFLGLDQTNESETVGLELSCVSYDEAPKRWVHEPASENHCPTPSTPKGEETDTESNLTLYCFI